MRATTKVEIITVGNNKVVTFTEGILFATNHRTIIEQDETIFEAIERSMVESEIAHNVVDIEQRSYDIKVTYNKSK